ncbi:MAG: DUF177 domain-containing protein [Oscillospiraceae bacterium]|nr:DUF177 domain-containing protein [Oscillospiraceae bacterium]
MKLSILPLRQASGTSIPVSYAQDLSDLELFGEYPIPEKVAVEGLAENRAEMLLLHLTVRFTVKTRCARCLKPLSIDRELKVERVLVDSVEDEETLGDEEIVLIEDDAVDLSEIVREAVIFGAEMNYLCKEDCLGLCPRCGKDLNEGPCGCKPEIDERFAALADLHFD